MKNYGFLTCFVLVFVISTNVQSQKASFTEISPKSSIAFSLSSFANIFPSVNGAFEMYFNDKESIELELGYIYKSHLAEGAKGGIIKTTWKRTYKLTSKNRFYIGLQGQFQTDYVKGEAVYLADDFSHYRFDEFTRYKYRISALALVGRDFAILKRLHLSLNMNFGVQTLFVNLNAPDAIRDSYRAVQLEETILLKENIPIMPDGGVSVQLRYTL